MTDQRKKRKVEFGDFQTPLDLARDVCNVLTRKDWSPASVLESTCGKGVFLRASLEVFPGAAFVRGFEYNSTYVDIARSVVADYPNAKVEKGDFFSIDWDRVLSSLPDPILVIGNPPWVTNAAVGSIGGTNLPEKSNVDRLRGIEALTGRSNFDISEWMLRESLRWLNGRNAVLAVLCKTAVARKLLSFSWSNRVQIESAAIHRIDALKAFGASVDACLLVLKLQSGTQLRECDVYEDLSSKTPSTQFGMRGDSLVADIEAYDRLSFLRNGSLIGWRSGVKHDSSRVFELTKHDGALFNGLGEQVEIESDVVFPLMKSSDVAHKREPRKFVVIPHRSMRESPLDLQRRAPAAWEYLQSHSAMLNKRGSSIYRKRPPFSIFGIGPYTFTDWKIAISGLYKELSFAKIGPHNGRPVVFDDTCYLFPCESEEESQVLFELVTSPIATEFWSSLIFWDSKRPITSKLLNTLDLAALARYLNRWTPVARRLAERQMMAYSDQRHQRTLFPFPVSGNVRELDGAV